MPKTLLVVCPHMRVVSKQLITAQHELTKVHHTFALALRFIKCVNLYFFAHVLVPNHHVFSTLAVLFAACNKVHQLLGWKTLVINIELLAQALDARELVLRVQNLKGGGQIGQFVMRTQKAVAQAMKRANPHAAYIHRQHAGQAGQHLFGSLVGKRHCQNTAW